MKRELKEIDGWTSTSRNPIGHKANPDEKGTERRCTCASCTSNCCHKANPDEKGTESWVRIDEDYSRGWVTKPIPMKRELKGFRLHGQT